MKKVILFLLFVFYNTINCQQTVKVVYETISNPKISLNGAENISESMKEEMKTKVLQQAKQPKKFVLYYYNGDSFFQRELSEDKSVLEKQKIEYFRLKNKEGIFLLNDFKVEQFYGYYPMDNVTVEFINETQTIENFNCKLAIYKIGNTINKVWYTEEIPISAGPYNFFKVPGLVLKVESPNFLSYAVKISTENNKDSIKKMDSNLKVYSGEELKVKINEGLAKMRMYNHKKFESKKESFQGK